MTNREIEATLKAFKLCLKKENLKYIKKQPAGICFVLSVLYVEKKITDAEYLITRKYVLAHTPILYDLFSRSSFFWKPGRIAPRRRYLKKHIRRLTKECWRRYKSQDITSEEYYDLPRCNN